PTRAARCTCKDPTRLRLHASRRAEMRFNATTTTPRFHRISFPYVLVTGLDKVALAAQSELSHTGEYIRSIWLHWPIQAVAPNWLSTKTPSQDRKSTDYPFDSQNSRSGRRTGHPPAAQHRRITTPRRIARPPSALISSNPTASSPP